MWISIHTLTQRVTCRAREIIDKPVISIHTLTQRVTERKRLHLRSHGISIHTLTQRVTLWVGMRIHGQKYFNPHPHAEGDAMMSMTSGGMGGFQSTPSRRG